MGKHLKIVKRKDLDKSKWNALVVQSGVSVYNQSYYLDSLAEHWLAIIGGDYACGMAVPYSIRLGVKGIYTPNFLRAVDWMGEIPDTIELEELLKTEFTRSNLNINQAIFKDVNELHYQAFHSLAELKLGSQSKRSIKKANTIDFKVSSISIEEALPFVVEELKEKVKSLRSIDFLKFQNLLLNYDPSNCFCYGIKTDQLHAVAIIIRWNHQWHYIKGAVSEFGKKNGLMHYLIHDSIVKAFESGCTYSFEGSNVASVRQFNLGFGAKDITYYNWSWNNSPIWFRLLLLLRK